MAVRRRWTCQLKYLLVRQRLGRQVCKHRKVQRSEVRLQVQYPQAPPQLQALLIQRY